MSLQPIDLAGIAKLDNGALALAFKQALGICTDDVEDRPHVKAARQVTMTVSLTPNVDGADLQSFDIGFKFLHKLPKKESRQFNAKRVRGGLALNELSPDDANQMTIDEAGPTPTATGTED